jgi:hypothetical protein
MRRGSEISAAACTKRVMGRRAWRHQRSSDSLDRAIKVASALVSVRDVQGHRGAPLSALGTQEIVGVVAVELEPMAHAVPERGVDGDQVGIERQHGHEADPELPDRVVAVLLGALEEDGEILLEDLLAHARAVVVHRDPNLLLALLVDDAHLDAGGARVDRVLHQLSIERVGIGELADDVGDEALVVLAVDRLRLSAPVGAARRFLLLGHALSVSRCSRPARRASRRPFARRSP